MAIFTGEEDLCLLDTEGEDDISFPGSDEESGMEEERNA